MKRSFHPALAVLGAGLLGVVMLAVSLPAAAQEKAGARLEMDGGTLLWSGDPRPTFEGVTGAPPGSVVTVMLETVTLEREAEEGKAPPEPQRAETTVGERGHFRLAWPRDLAAGGYRVAVAVTAAEDPQRVLAQARATLVVQLGEGLPRRPLVAPPLDYAPPFEPAADRFEAFTDRWRIVPPPYELNAQGSRWDPYNQNVLKGDYPVKGNDIFFVLTGISDTLVQGMNLPTPAGVSTAEPGSIEFFGEDGQLFLNQNVVISAELFRGDTAFKPMDWRIKATLVGNLNHLETQENAVVKPDVREGTDRTDGRASLQEFFVEKKLADLSTSYDFLSLRVGIQPFSSDFRGFVFTDTNLALRLFGNADSNRWQYNLYLSERLEKDTNSGLNLFELRDQQVAVANVYRQDTFALGWTHQLSLHYLRDEPSFFFDRNGFLARPDPVGSFTPHEVEALYLGWTSFGHSGRLNIDHALYYVTGEDSLNPIAGEDLFAGRSDVDISAFFGALELSIDRNWYRPKLSLLYASGDDSPTDRDAEGFDAIFDNPAFAGGGFSFWNRLGIRLAGTGTGLVNRGSLLPNLRSSKEEGQPNFVNPGLLLASAGLDLELTPELKAVATANYLRFDSTEAIQLLLFQSDIDEEIGWDLSLGARWRPYLNNNVVLLAGVAAFLPGAGFEDIYQSDDSLYMGFVNLTLTF
ncbi:MAG: hypothetical protein SX243_00890 [Acidobacteriota bacterium]|nr:hypothetical protein [Acidobacteriota bacterium]